MSVLNIIQFYIFTVFLYNSFLLPFSFHKFLLLSFVATQSTFLASAWIIEKNKISISNNQKKSFFYTGGVTEGFETIICFAAMLIFYEFISYISYIFGFLCWITFIMRIFFIKKLLDTS